MANEFIARKGLIALEDSVISGSLHVRGDLTVGKISNQSELVDVGGNFNFDTVAEPTSAERTNFSSSIISSAGNVDNGTHYYHVIYKTSDGGETGAYNTPFLAATITDNTTAGQVELTGIPTSSDARVTARDIYRTEAGDNQYYSKKLATISDNTTTTYTDNLADSSLDQDTLFYRKANSTAGYFYKDNNLFAQAGNAHYTSFGVSALESVTIGQDNVAFGGSALQNTTSGRENTAIGYSSGVNNTTGWGNTYLGYVAGYFNETGIKNTAVGSFALRQAALTSTSYNTAVGQGALWKLTGSNDHNTAIGHAAGQGYQGAYNVHIGSYTGYKSTEGSGGDYNINIGYYTGNDTTGDNNILIGRQLEAPNSGSNNQLNIGNLIYATGLGLSTTQGTGNVGIGTTSPISKLDVVGDARATNFQVDSGNRYKIGNGSQYITGTNDTAVEIYSGGSSRLYVSSSGNVGIGTPSPESTLTVNGYIQVPNSRGITFTDIGDGNVNRVSIVASEDNDTMFFRTDNGVRMAIANGNVGIGTISPSYKLTVSDGTIGSEFTTVSNHLARKVDLTSANASGLGAFTYYNTNTAATPDFMGKYGYTFYGGTSTAAKQFQVFVGDAVNPRMVVRADARVGIGTTAPTETLHVVGNVLVTGKVTAEEFHTEFVSASIIYQSGSTKFGDTSDDIHSFTGSVYISGSTNLTLAGDTGNATFNVTDAGDLTIVADDDIRFDAKGNDIVYRFNGTELGRMSSANSSTDLQLTTSVTNGDILLIPNGSGRVGIGTTSPSQKLHVDGNGRFNGDIYINGQILRSDSTGTKIGFDNNVIRLHTNTSERMRIDSVGNVGIGTTSPSAKLDVNGNVKISGANRVLEGSSPTTRLRNMTALPGGYVESDTFNFRFDESATAYAGESGGIGGTLNQTTGTSISSDNLKRLFTYTANYINLNTHKDANGNVVIELVDIAVSNSANTQWKPYVFFHASSGNVESMSIEVLNGNSTWETVEDAIDCVDFYIRDGFYTTSAGILRGVRYTFTNITGNSYLRMIGVIGKTHASYQWNVLKSGGDMFGDLTFNDNYSTYYGNAGDLRIYHNATDSFINNTTGNLYIRSSNAIDLSDTNGTSRMYLTSAGNVGIGTTSPSEKLDVAGNIRLSGNIVDANTGENIEIGTNDIRVEHKHLAAEFGLWARSSTLSSRLMGIDGAATYMGLYTNGSERVRIDTSGNVGIGNTNPTHTVEIGTDGGGEKILKMHSDTASSYFEIQSLGNVARLLATNSTNLLLQSDGTGGYITFNANSAERMRIDSSGRLLLNSTSTSFSDKLYINNSGYATGGWRVGTSGTYVGKLYNSNGVLSLETDSTRDIQFGSVTNGTAMFIEGSNGNVGIGNTSPTEKLTVEGNISASGDLYLNGIIQTDEIRSRTYPNYNILNLEDDNVQNSNGVSLLSAASMVFGLDVNDNSTSDQFEWRTDGATANSGSLLMTLTDEGDLGIGTSAPTLGKVHVVQSSDAVTEGITVEETSGGNTMRLWMDGSTRKINAGGSNTMIEFDTSKVAFPTGNVGIGVLSPSYKLHIDDTTNSSIGIKRVGNSNTLELKYNTDPAIINITGNDGLQIQKQGTQVFGFSQDRQVYINGDQHVSIQNNGSTNLYVSGSGNVGIGTTDPRYATLQVQGSGLFSGTLQVQGNLNLREDIYTLAHDAQSFVPTITRYDGGSELGLDYDYVRSINGNNGGNVGIGTTNPLTNLHIANSGGAAQLSLERTDTSDTLKLVIGSSYGYLQNTTGPLSLGTTNDNQQIYIATDGDVGIGTTSPSQKLTVSGSIAIHKNAEYLYAKTTGGNNVRMLGINNSDVAYVGPIDAGPVTTHFNASSTSTAAYFYTSGSIKMAIGSTGNVGIGTTSPETQLDITGDLTIGDKIYTRADGNRNTYIDSGTDRWTFYVANPILDLSLTQGAVFNEGGISTMDFRVESDTNSHMLFVDAGNDRVGIGTTSPSATLHVSGSGGGSDVLLVEPAGAPTISLKSNSTLTDYSGLHVGNKYLFLTKNSGAIFQQVQGGLRFANGFAAKSVITENGYFGIGFNTTTGIDYPLDVKGDARISGSGIFTNGLTVTGSINHDGDLTVSGIVTAQEFHTEFVSASIIYQSGSTKFGDTADDTHSFTGSLEVSASIKMTGNGHSYAYPLEITSDSIKLPSDSTASRSILRQAGSSTGGFLSLRDGSGNEKAMIRSYASSGVQAFFTAGNVGIGTTTPRAKLDIQDSTHGTLMLSRPSETGYAMISGSSGLGFEFKTYDAGEVMAMKIANDGKVGIGTTSPSASLSIGDGTTSNVNVYLNKKDNNTAGYYVVNEGNSSGRTAFIRQTSGEDAEVGTSSTNNLSFLTNDTVRVHIDGDNNNGNVGIGTTSPSEKLHVSGGAWFAGTTADDTQVLALGQKEGSNGSTPLVKIYTDDIGTDTLDFHIGRYTSSTRFTHASSSSSDRISSVDINGHYTAGGSILLYGAGGTGGVKTRIGADVNTYFIGSNVGIGTNSPTQALTVAGNIIQTSTSNFIGTRKVLGISAGGLDLMDDSGTNGISIKDGGNVQFTDYGSGNNTGTAAYTLAVDSSGNIIEESIEAAAVTGGSTSGLVSYWDSSSSITGSAGFTFDGETLTAPSFVETSARRFKENIKPIEGALDKVVNLQGVTFNRIGEEKHEYGFIADEVKDVVPELVTHNAEGDVQGIHYARTVAILTEAIKELDNKVKAQDLFINDLVARIEKLENK